MSQHLPVLSGGEVVKAFLRLGYTLLNGRGKGSHHVVFHPEKRILLTIPDHDTIKRGTLRRIIRQSSFSVEEFRSQL